MSKVFTVIESSSNPKVKKLRALYSKKGRDAQGLFVAEGVNIVKDIPQGVRVDSIYAAASKREEGAQIAAKFGLEPILVEDELFARIGDTVTPSGLIAVVEKPRYEQTMGQKIMVLDGIQDAGNAGTIIRTAAACGFSAVCAFSSVDLFSPKCVRSTMGGVFRIPLYEMEYDDFHFQGQVYLLDMKGENLFDFTPADSYAVVVGSEAKGASAYFRNRANTVLSIPMARETESLNASVSAALAMYVLQNFRR